MVDPDMVVDITATPAVMDDRVATDWEDMDSDTAVVMAEDTVTVAANHTQSTDTLTGDIMDIGTSNSHMDMLLPMNL
jgi:hypothetical protein